MNGAPARPALSTFRQIYGTACAALLTLLILFAAANLAAHWALRASETAARTPRFEGAILRAVYPGRSEPELRALATVRHGIGFDYEPYVEIRNETGMSKLAGVHETGFRFVGKDQGPWPPDSRAINVFLFGGTAAFARDLPDEQTFGAFVQQALREQHPGVHVNVYDFATEGHFSTQERIYLEHLLVRGFVPDLALFVDGYDDFALWRGEPVLTDWFRRLFVETQSASHAQALTWYFAHAVRQLPLLRWIERRTGTSPFQAALAGPAGRNESYYQDPEKITRIVGRYRANQRMIDAAASRFGFAAAYVWAPLPPKPAGEFRRMRHGYPEVAKLVKSGDLGERVVWCPEGVANKLPAMFAGDGLRLNGQGNFYLAQCAADGVRLGGLLAAALRAKDARRP
jgi:hypothetical protein